MSKYDGLFRWLQRQRLHQLNISFSRIEYILGFELPGSARIDPQWWENDPGHVQAKAWLQAGFRTADVDLTGEKLTLVRF